jgi:SAM-dependent methyltransferase
LEDTIVDVTSQNTGPQSALWNGPAGRVWVEEQALLDRLFAPFAELLVEHVARLAPAAVLDVGCGAGGTTLAIAGRLGGTARCVGVDISDPLIATARARAMQAGLAAEFIRADAQTHAFEADTFEAIVSRFGVMFFDDPIAAFANLRHASRSGASLRCIAWRSAAENPFMIAAERAAAPFLPALPPRRTEGPGQFGFADPQRVRAILADGGWTGVDVLPIDVPCTLPGPDLERYLTRLGPVGLLLRDADDETQARVREAVRTSVAPFMDGSDARFTAACWLVEAGAGSGR